jgi:branched-chain amino acid transport system substrate-binding protein
VPALLAACLRGAIVILLLAAACTANTPAAPPTQTLATAASGVGGGAPAGPLKIGVLVPFTEASTDAEIGASQRRAADLYLKLQGGKLAGRDVQLVFDDESSLEPKINQIRIQQFIEKDHVEMLLGGAGTPAAYQLRDMAEASKMVYVDTNASGNALTRTTPGCAPSCKSRFTFRSSASSWQMSEPLGEWASKSGLKDFYLVYSDDAFGNESASDFSEGLAKNGGRSAARAAIPPKSGAEWPKIVAAIKAQPAKSVFAAFITDDAEGFINAWGAAGMRAAGYRLFGPGPFADAEVLKATKQAGAGIVSSFYWSSDLDNAENKTFIEEFGKAYKDESTGQPLVPDGYAVEMWDAMKALDAALRSTKGDARNTDALIAALEAATFKGPTGDFSFDKGTHNPTEDVYIREAKTSGSGVVNTVIDKIGSVKDPGQ